MSAYAIPITTAFFVFILIASIGTVPWTIYQYRKHGYFSFWRNFIVFSFLFYCLTAFFLVSLPLPNSRNNTLQFKDHVYTQLNPANFITNFKQVPGFHFNELRTYPLLIHSFTFLEVFFNLLLLLPLGIYLRYFFKDKRKWYIALIISFSVTLFFELSQLTAMFGYYAYPYRLFDVDDLLMNSLGAMIGFFLAPLLLWLIPSRDNINERDKQFSHNQLASYGAQLIELIVTVSISKMLATSISLLIMKDTPFFLIQTVTLFFFSVLMPYFFKGKTVGGMLVRLRLTSSLDKSFFMSLITRFLIIYIPSMMGLFTSFINQFSNENIYVLSLQIGFLLFSLLFWLFIGFDILKKWLKKYPEPYFNHYASIEAIRYIHNAKP